MKIVDMQAHLLAIPIREKDFPAQWSWGNFNQIIVEIQTDEGITGYGEAFGYGVPQATASVIDQVLKPMLIGADPAKIPFLSDQLFRQTHLYGRYGITTFAISGVDIALWDILGKCAGLPLYRLLGGTRTGEVPAYASLVRYKDQGEIRAAAFHAKRAGYAAIKLHQLDVESLKTVREAVGGETQLMVDVNCPWSPEQALDMALKFKPYRIAWLEEPIWPPEDFRSLARLRELSGIPIASGENACTVFQFREMMEAGAAAYIQPSVVKVGGVSEWRKVATLAEPYNVRIAPHSPYFGPGFLASAHLVASNPYADMIEHLYVNLEASVFKQPLKFEKGYFQLPQGPGLGLEIDPDVLRHYGIS
jgi:L-alanine-DL-glutamate epimerase-like enolase superfamily enzyme